MELKEIPQNFKNKASLSFNRTFMELKVVLKLVVGIAVAVFQSHLYGIESQLYQLYSTEPDCFNRTFMELKEILVISATFASTVSIAPLWNWKLA